MATVKMAVSIIIIANTKENPITNDNISVVFFSKREYPITIGIKGNTHGDNTEAIPAKNENRKLISILSLIFNLFLIILFYIICKNSSGGIYPSCLFISLPLESMNIIVGTAYTLYFDARSGFLSMSILAII